ncbi:MAG: SDR family oxidoreductase [Desulfuromonadaceae bacterium]|nr:SDR family oxidoreductase [Desulfuromonadaceae bacterium]
MKGFFVTGASGVVGSALVPVLLQRYAGNVYLLLRAEDENHLQQRFTQLLDYWEFKDAQTCARLVPCRGDMTHANLGLTERCYTEVAASCRSIIHCGGVVRMNLPLEQARAAALAPAQEIVALGEQMQRRAGLKKIDYISTVGVIGKLHRPLTEVFVQEERDFHNTYEQAKAETENYLAAKMDTLPITIHRPSMVVGDSRSGKNINFQVFYHLCEFLSGKRTFGLLPDLGDAVLDIVPSDYVANVIAWSVGESSLAAKIVHACSGVSSALKVAELESYLLKNPYFSRGRRLFGRRNIHLPVPLFNLLIRGVSKVVAPKEAKALNTLPHFLEYLSDPQVFDDTATRHLLAQVPIAKPVPKDYLPAILDYYLKIKHT